VLWKETGLYKVARTGEAEFVPVVDDAWLRSTTRDEAHLAVARANAPRSMVMVPLVGHAGVIGVLSLAIVDEGRRYDTSDLAAARAIADRAALAIENARLYEQMVEAKRLRDEVLGIVSHDLRNPLNAILLSARVLARRAPAEEVSAIERAAKRADALIQDLLTVAVLEAAAMPLDKRSHSLSSIVDEAIDLHRPLADERAMELQASVGAGVGSVNIDRNRLLQVLGNLIGNALKFTEPRGRVRLEARASEASVVVSVADTGPGIAPDALPHVFDRFWQGAKARRAGAGLGLAIAKGIVEAHGGTIAVESVPGRGATFTFTIPRPGA
jgi:signal transduction histidine kinase